MKKLIERFRGNIHKEKVSFGLDIGTSSIKTIKLKFTKTETQLVSFSIEPNDALHTQETLKKIKSSHEQLEYVNLGVSGPATVIRYINFPKMESEDFKKALKFEAQKHIPFSVEEVNLDGYILKETLPNNKMLVLIAAVKKDFMNQRLKLIEDSGLRPEIVDLDSMALINVFNLNYPQEEIADRKATAILNIGAAISNLNILEGGIPRLSRDMHVAGNNITQKLMEVLGVDFNAAENMKINPQPDKSAKIASAVESVLTNLYSEIRTSFDYYESQNASSVSKIFLSGGSSRLPGLKDILANLLGIEVEYWDPLKNINIADTINAQKISSVSSQLAVAVGLALRKEK